MTTKTSANRCADCGGNRTEGTTTITVEMGFGIVVVRHVPAFVCQQCGSEWIADPVASQVEQIVNAARLKHTQVEILAFS